MLGPAAQVASLAATVIASMAQVARRRPDPASPLASLSTSSSLVANQAPPTSNQVPLTAIGAQLREKNSATSGVATTTIPDTSTGGDPERTRARRGRGPAGSKVQRSRAWAMPTIGTSSSISNRKAR